MSIFSNLFNEDKKILKEIESKVEPILALENTMSSLSDDDLKNKTQEFKNRLQNGETLDDILPEAFAVAREACKRVIGEFPYPCQLEGGVALHNGDIAEYCVCLVLSLADGLDEQADEEHCCTCCSHEGCKDESY